MTFRDQLQLNATAGKLAQAIYYAEAEAFGIAIKDWPALDYQKKQTYVQRATDLLEEYRPAPRRSIEYMHLVRAAIDPSMPWGA